MCVGVRPRLQQRREGQPGPGVRGLFEIRENFSQPDRLILVSSRAMTRQKRRQCHLLVQTVAYNVLGIPGALSRTDISEDATLPGDPEAVAIHTPEAGIRI